MTVTHDDLDRDLVATAMRAQRSSLLYTAAATVVIAGLVGGFLYYSITKLSSVNAAIAQQTVALNVTTAKLTAAQHVLKESGGQLEIVTRKLDDSQAGLRKAQAALAASRTELDTTSGQLRDTGAKLDDTQKRLAAAEEQLHQSANVVRHIRALDLGDVKAMASRSGRSSRYLMEVAEASQSRQIRWGLVNSIEGGFTSPGFARFILQRTGAPNPDIDSLPVRQGPPHAGDLIRYASGYALFYFPATYDRAHPEFVIGMTPFGIVSLAPDFGVQRVDIRITPQSD
jgi:hypothetical protein